jgi:RimJ/RimL family protein N-acetyltransferase
MSNLPDEFLGARLRLNRKTVDDVDDALEAVNASFDELHVWMRWAASRPSRESILALTRDDDERFRSDERWAYWVREIDGGHLVGSATLDRRGLVGELEIGYWIRSDRTRRGYATEATSILTSAAFTYVPTTATVKISMDRANTASAAVPRKLGFVPVAEYEREIITPGHSGTGAAWITSREEWLGRTS